MRTLTISTGSDQDAWMAQLVEQAEAALASGQYQGEYLNFATPGAFFSHLTTHRWNILSHLVGRGTVGVRELARQLARDVKRVHADAQALVELGLLEKTPQGALRCPYGRIAIEMTLDPDHGSLSGASPPRRAGTAARPDHRLDAVLAPA